MEANASRATSSPIHELIRKWLPKLPVALPVYGVLIGFAYMWGFWGKFDINPFQYIAITDIVVTSAQYIAPIILALALSIPSLIANVSSKPNAYSKPDGEAENKKKPPVKSAFERALIKLGRVLPSLDSVLRSPLTPIAPVALLILGLIQEWDNAVTIATALFIFILILTAARYRPEVVLNPTLLFTIGFAIMLPALVFDHGAKNARDIRRQRDVVTIMMGDREPLTFTGAHLGHLGDHDFFLENDMIRVLPSDAIQMIERIDQADLQHQKTTELLRKGAQELDALKELKQRLQQQTPANSETPPPDKQD